MQVRVSRPFVCLALAACAMIGAACSDSPSSPSNSAPFSQTDIRLGTGATAAAGGTLTVHYTGWLYEASRPDQKGVQFDSSLGTEGFTFTLGAGRVIAGWDQGVAGMREGGIRRLVIPPSLAYGDSRNSSIPPSSTLVFEIELLNVQ